MVSFDDKISILLKRYKIHPNKNLGQHFLFNANITDKIVALVTSIDNKIILELGAGPGILSRSILKKNPKHLYLIEKDHKFEPVLSILKDTYHKQLSLNFIDGMDFDISKLYEQHQQKITIIANLPYNIGSILLIKWLRQSEYIDRMVLMLQKEVVERIVSSPKKRSYGSLSIIANAFCKSRKHFDVAANSFYPPPKVVSSIVELTTHSNPILNVNFDILEKLCKLFFAEKRKKIKTGLKKLSCKEKDFVEDLGIDTNLRPEDLSVEDYCRIANWLQRKDVIR